MVSKGLLTAAALLAGASQAKYTVHIVPHSHDDVGWLKSVNAYFDGSNRDIKWASVELTLSNVIDSLISNPERKFSEVEMKFFSMWFDEQPDWKKEKVKDMVKTGQLEIINGGWSMHDEACPSYDDMINNMMFGQQWALTHLGAKPKIGWQIDPFGHSNANIRLFYEMGFDAWFFARMDEGELQKRIENKELEWIHRPSGLEFDGERVEIFTHKLNADNLYHSPLNFDFDVYASDPIWQDDQGLSTFNGDEQGQRMDAYLTEYVQNYATDQILLLFGGDFQFMNAEYNFLNIDKMIHYMNTHYSDKYEFKYSTPSEYVKAVNSLNHTWPVKTDDMFPYSNTPRDYWTGFFTSRANSKGEVRRGSHNLHASASLYAVTSLSPDISPELKSKQLDGMATMLDVMGVYQHHDAVSGTGKQAVANDYSRLLAEATATNNEAYSETIAAIVKQQTGLELSNLEQCYRFNTSYLDCPISAYNLAEGENMTITVHNPSSYDYEQVEVAIPAKNFTVSVFESSSETSGFTTLPRGKVGIHCHDDAIFTGFRNQTKFKNCKLFAQVKVPARQIVVLQLQLTGELDSAEPAEVKETASIESSKSKLTFLGSPDQQTLSFSIVNKETGAQNDFDFSLKNWPSYVSYTTLENSGPYIFRPIDNLFEALPYSHLKSAQVSSGAVAPRLVFEFGRAAKSGDFQEEQAIVIVSLEPNQAVAKIEIDLFGLPDIFTKGYEVVAEFQAHHFHNAEEIFYTDSNGLHLQERKLNWRSYFNITEYNGGPGRFNITSNFYPVNYLISTPTNNGEDRMSVFNDRAQAGSSHRPGQVQLMQNRRIPCDDDKGVKEWLNETDEFGNGMRVPATYYLSFHASNTSTRSILAKQTEPLQYFFTNETEKAGTPAGDPLGKLALDLSEKAGLQPEVRVVAYPLGNNVVMARLENLEDTGNNETTKVNVEALGKALWSATNSGDVSVGVVETSINGVFTIEELQEKKLSWKTEDSPASTAAIPTERSDQKEEVVLSEQQIKTYIFKYQAE